MANPVYWCGDAPTHCDISGRPIVNVFVDGATTLGPWANMDLKAHRAYGRGLGLGKGQKYEKQPDGKWLKVAG